MRWELVGTQKREEGHWVPQSPLSAYGDARGLAQRLLVPRPCLGQLKMIVWGVAEDIQGHQASVSSSPLAAVSCLLSTDIFFQMCLRSHLQSATPPALLPLYLEKNQTCFLTCKTE